ncbi:uncharacterized protein LOC143322894 [Chaetodon auriga]|uniref:uncharacterized protein LOC143322894 n=1 Tax=Chaetodon auriga TaxID=39042 RepID=UPI004032BABB
MGNYLLSAIGWLCLLHTGVCSEECSPAVLAGRDTFYAPAGSSLSLSCVVLHCGDTWTGKWMWRNPTDEKLTVVQASERHHLTRVKLSDHETQLILNFLSVNQSDEGSYGCSVTWGQGDTDQGHSMYVNVTEAVPSQRSVLHRILVCVGAFICLPVILGLAHCLSSKVKPQPLPSPLPTYAAVYRDRPHPAPQPPPRCPVPQKRSTSSYKAAPKSKQKTEVVYADISQGALGQQAAPREPAQSTVYSSLTFS